MRREIGASAGVIALLAFFLHTQFPPGTERSPELESGHEEHHDNERPAADMRHPVEGPWIATHAFFGHTNWWTMPSGPYAIHDENQSNDLRRIDFQAVLRGLLAPNGPLNQQDKVRRLMGVTGARAWAISTVVATVADPLHTRLPLFTDEQIEAIVRSARQSGWEFANQWLPWLDHLDPNQGDINERRGQRRLQREQEAFPGVLVFRRAPDKDASAQFRRQALLIFLVPETPTSGLSRTAFYAAMNIADALAPRGSSIGIVGPSFSGSLHSLDSALNEWATTSARAARLNYRIYSGSVSSWARGKAFENSVNAGFESKNFRSLQFRSTLASDEDQCAAFLALLRNYHIDPEDAAYLKEDETAYGTSGDCSDVREYIFPRDIAHVRNAYQESVAASHLPNAQPEPTIAFSLKDPNSGEDSIPIFSDSHTPVSQNTAIAVVADELRRRQTRLVYLTATNVLDTLFLARFLREQSPDLRVVTGDADLLFIAAANQVPVIGTLFLSTYPMFPDGDEWLTGVPTEHPTFSSPQAQGTFNALQFLLADMCATTPPIQPRPWSFGQPKHDHPGIWLLSLNRVGFEPLALFDPEDLPSNPNDPAESRQGTHAQWFPQYNESSPSESRVAATLGWLLITSSLIVFTGIVLACLRRKFPIAKWKPRTASPPALMPAVAMCLSLGSALFLLALPVVTGFPEKQSDSHWRLEQNLIAWTAILVAASALVVGFRMAATPFSETPSRLVRRLQTYHVVAVLVVLGLFAGWIWLCWMDDQNYSAFFFRFRSVHVFSGSSPVWPLVIFCLAGFGISYAYLWRFEVAGATRPRLKFDPSIAAGMPAEVAVKRLSLWAAETGAYYQNVNDQIAAPTDLAWRPLAVRFAVCGGLLALCALSMQGYALTFDKLAYNAVLMGGYLLILFALATGCYDLWKTWDELEKFILKVEYFPSNACVKRISRLWPRRPIWAFQRERRKKFLEVELINALRDRHEAAKQLPYGRLAAEKDLQEIRDDRSFKNQEKLQSDAARIANDILMKDLIPVWATAPTKEVKEEDLPPQERLKFRYDEACASLFSIVLVRFVVYAVYQIRNIAWMLSFGFVMLLLLFNSYSPRGPMMLARFLALCFLAIGFVIVRVFAQMERNSLLSRISHGKPGELNREFWFQMIALGGLPLLGVLAHLFPQISQFLTSWVAPGVQEIH
ncbi:MAG TPA: hypothetical protein VMB85_07835 [Bryobacteraceae bacterium]|nr:hypothetical protein [Bryobacteraceae bacterium]